MSNRHSISRNGTLPILTIALTISLTACGGTAASPGASSAGDAGQTGGNTAQAGTVNEEARALLPAEIRDRGVLNMGTSLSWAPFGYKDESGQPTGLDIGLIQELGKELGLKVAITDVEFQAMVPGVSNGRFDVAMNQLEDTPERREVVQFVHYYEDAIGVLTQADVEIDPADLCGRDIAVTQGSSQATVIERLDATCQEEGKAPIDAKVFPDSAATILAVQSKRVESMLMGTASAQYLVQSEGNGGLKVADGYVPDTEALSGIVVAKDNDELAASLQVALQGLVDDGWYASYLDEFGVGDQALTEITIGKG